MISLAPAAKSKDMQGRYADRYFGYWVGDPARLT